MDQGLTDVPGLLVGHWTDLAAGTGCTAILTPQGAVAGVDVRGGAPGTRETALLDPTCLVEQVHGIMLAGGSAFGLAAADGAMRWLEEQGYGFHVGVARVPIVPAAILFDLVVGRADVRPDAAAGYAACAAATSGPIAEGCVGAATGATIGKVAGVDRAMKGGLGTASHRLESGLIVAALAAVNAWGSVVDPRTGRVIAGPRHAEGGLIDPPPLGDLLDAAAPAAWSRPSAPKDARKDAPSALATNTTLVVVATNARLTKAQATKVAQMAHDGLARTIRPVHTPRDGDVVFALSQGEIVADVGLVGALAAEVAAAAIVRGVWAATTLYGLPAARDLTPR
jgi:L-aminopeptidase/D-esterase-like protein